MHYVVQIFEYLSGSIESDFSLIVVVIRFAIIGGLSMFGIIYF